MSGDQITVLRSLGPNLCKTWTSAGPILPYDNAKNFTVTQHEVDGIEALRNLLVSLEPDPRSCIIRGAPKTSESPVRRLIENFEDRPLHSVLIEVDSFHPLIAHPVLEPVDAALEFIAEHLPDPFHDASFAWQLSNSAGAPGKEAELRIHLWWFLTDPYDSATLRAWAKSLDLQFDKSVLNPVQCHWTSGPIMEEGRVDPVPVRSGLFRSERDSVDLKINTDELDVRHQGERQHGERLAIDDPLTDWVLQNWETWGETRDGGILCSCPFEDSHSGGAKGDSSTVLFPAGTRGYAEPRWVCLHDSCRDRPQAQFAQKIGYNPLAALAAEPEEKPLNGHHVDFPGLPRNAAGQVDATVNNLRIAVGSAQMAGMGLRHDAFRDEVVAFPNGAVAWRAFKDHDYTDVRLRLESNGFKPISTADLRDIIHWTAQTNPFDSAIYWLNQLTWDGTPRIERFWIDHFGVVDDNAGYAKAVGLYTWTALAGRAMDPGVQADMVPVLVGAQGVGKSRGVAAMAPLPDFATNMSFHEPEVERARKMRGKLVVELAELQGLKSREREEILAWITRSVEHWTPKFMEMSTTFARRFICFATTNEDDFLDNPTGERRWLPMLIGGQPGFEGVDVQRIHDLCEQLWAEARDLYLQSGVAWREAERLARAEHGKFKAEDGWEQAVSAWLDKPDMAGETPRHRKWLTLHDVAEGALSMPARTVRFSDQRRLGKILRTMGYDLTPRKIGGKSVKVWMGPAVDSDAGAEGLV